MKRFTPFGALLICAMIGLIFGNFGLWLSLGMVAFIIVGVAQNQRERGAALTAGGRDDVAQPGDAEDDEKA